MSGIHISGRGFLASYSTTNKTDLITCLEKAIRFSDPEYRKYCPAGCLTPFGEISGTIPIGYRDSSLLCMAGIHAGVLSNALGGPISIVISNGIAYYDTAQANNVTSKVGSLSSTLFTFKTGGCYGFLGMENGAIPDSQITASSVLEWTDHAGQINIWKPERARLKKLGPAWAASFNDEHQWLQIDLNKLTKVSGIITTGSTMSAYNYYVTSYRIEHSEDGLKWTVYKEANVDRDKQLLIILKEHLQFPVTEFVPLDITIFQANVDYYQEVRNNLIPPIVARFVKIRPASWNQKIAMKVELLGCQFIPAPVPKLTVPPAFVPRAHRPLPVGKTTSPPEIKNTTVTPDITKAGSTMELNLVTTLIESYRVIIMKSSKTLQITFIRKTSRPLLKPSTEFAITTSSGKQFQILTALTVKNPLLCWWKNLLSSRRKECPLVPVTFLGANRHTIRFTNDHDQRYDLAVIVDLAILGGYLFVLKLAVGLGVELHSTLNPKRSHKFIFDDPSPYQYRPPPCWRLSRSGALCPLLIQPLAHPSGPSRGTLISSVHKTFEKKKKTEGTYDLPYWDRAGWWKGMKQFLPAKSAEHEETPVRYSSCEVSRLRPREMTTMSAEYAQPLVGGAVGTLHQRSTFKPEEIKEGGYADLDSYNSPDKDIYHAYAEPLPTSGPEYATPIIMEMSAHPAGTMCLPSTSTFKGAGSQAPVLVGTYNKLVSRTDSSSSAQVLYDTPKVMPGTCAVEETVYQVPQPTASKDVPPEV
ncbi:unnamed protein product [Ranitomeya imitator]|uniref:Discoidin, CUB and LCCL domain-containing protein 2 n=1 Tax=Ranitomeya imitator TaxID=111125 RepID=A0ABN9KSB0_9NEOB|nr:unnamed protein product [Ranitomeya imitator]